MVLRHNSGHQLTWLDQGSIPLAILIKNFGQMNKVEFYALYTYIMVDLFFLDKIMVEL